jgi:hypothetical protein
MSYARHWISRLRLFKDEGGNIGSQLIAMTLLQQQNRVRRPTEKAVAHQGQDGLAERGVDGTLVEGVKPCLV